MCMFLSTTNKVGDFFVFCLEMEEGYTGNPGKEMHTVAKSELGDFSD